MLGQRGVNISYACKICDKSFATSSNRARHEKAFHGTPIHPKLIFPSIQQQLQRQQHSFTCIVAGCTACGSKLFWRMLRKR